MTSKAKSKIRAYVQNEERKRGRQIGHDLLEREFRKFGYNLAKNLSDSIVMGNDELRKTGANDMEDLFVRVGYGKVLPHQVVKAIFPDAESKNKNPEEETFFQKAYNSCLLYTSPSPRDS